MAKVTVASWLVDVPGCRGEAGVQDGRPSEMTGAWGYERNRASCRLPARSRLTKILVSRLAGCWLGPQVAWLLEQHSVDNWTLVGFVRIRSEKGIGVDCRKTSRRNSQLALDRALDSSRSMLREGRNVQEDFRHR